MARTRQKRWVFVAVLVYPALILLVALLGNIDPTAMQVVSLGVTAAFGAVVYRWWAALLPALWGGISLGGVRISDWITGTCSVCGGDVGWNNAWAYTLFLVVGPLTLAMLVGFGVGWLARRFSDSPSKRWVSHSFMDRAPSAR
jgi:hypothetical protein